jgi:alpha-D-ribose 1-methylphosphonate 5-triphosphate synthase subunit PhnH
MQKEITYHEVFDAQQHFRIILDCVSRPGKLGFLPDILTYSPGPINNASLLIGFALLNADVTFFTREEEVAAYLALNTGSCISNVKKADFIFIGGEDEFTFLDEIKIGSLSYPEESATLIIDVEEIAGYYLTNAVSITLKGPGVKTEKSVFIRGISISLLEKVKEKNAEFPLGTDMIITDKKNVVVCIPRSNQFIVGL